MKASELIEELKKQIDENGDKEVEVFYASSKGLIIEKPDFVFTLNFSDHDSIGLNIKRYA